jgi:hypothetical protein
VVSVFVSAVQMRDDHGESLWHPAAFKKVRRMSVFAAKQNEFSDFLKLICVLGIQFSEDMIGDDIFEL